jgi:hypothetical protein
MASELFGPGGEAFALEIARNAAAITGSLRGRHDCFAEALRTAAASGKTIGRPFRYVMAIALSLLEQGGPSPAPGAVAGRRKPAPEPSYYRKFRRGDGDPPGLEAQLARERAARAAAGVPR